LYNPRAGADSPQARLGASSADRLVDLPAATEDGELEALRGAFGSADVAGSAASRQVAVADGLRAGGSCSPAAGWSMGRRDAAPPASCEGGEAAAARSNTPRCQERLRRMRQGLRKYEARAVGRTQRLGASPLGQAVTSLPPGWPPAVPPAALPQASSAAPPGEGERTGERLMMTARAAAAHGALAEAVATRTAAAATELQAAGQAADEAELAVIAGRSGGGRSWCGWPGRRGGDDLGATAAAGAASEPPPPLLRAATAVDVEASRPPPALLRAVSAPQQADASDDLCSVCWEAPADATIVHGETGHVCCCITCAKQLRAIGSGCPICRAPIEAVIKHFRA